MKIIKSDLHKIAVEPKQYPQDELPEIAFAGRSNVGKSSFINSMINRANLARTSGKPGKTRTINFYIINDSFRFVDLPGYGYAQVSKSERKKWGEIIEKFLVTRENLREVILIVDIRHEPTEQDLMMYNWIKSFGYTGIVLATKADKISKGNYAKHVKIIKNKFDILDANLIIPYSSEKKTNKDEVWGIFKQILYDTNNDQ
jgi:GTP-binding protein